MVKTRKYLLITIMLFMVLTLGVGVSKWNIHYKMAFDKPTIEFAENQLQKEEDINNVNVIDGTEKTDAHTPLIVKDIYVTGNITPTTPENVSGNVTPKNESVADTSVSTTISALEIKNSIITYDGKGIGITVTAEGVISSWDKWDIDFNVEYFKYDAESETFTPAETETVTDADGNVIETPTDAGIYRAKIKAVSGVQNNPAVAKINVYGGNGTLSTNANGNDSANDQNKTTDLALAKINVYDENGTLSTNANGTYCAFIDFKIEPKPLTLTWSNNTFIYDGTAQAPSASITLGDVLDKDDVSKDATITITQSGNKIESAKNAGDYTATATLSGEDSGNYTITNDTQNFTIEQREVTLDWNIGTYIYNGNAQAPTATVANLVDGDDCTVEVEGAQTNAGTYKAKAIDLSGSSKDNYKLPENATSPEYTIIPRTVTLTWTAPENLVYDGTEKTPTVDVGNLVNGDSEKVTAQIALTNGKDNVNVGTFTFTATGLNNNDLKNYALPPEDVSPEYTITARAVTLTWSDTDLTYNGQAQKPTAKYFDVTGAEKQAVIKITSPAGIESAKNAGTYKATATLSGADSRNYSITNSTKEFTINQAEVTLTWNVGTYTYNGQEQAPTAQIPSGVVVIGDTCTVTVTGAKNAGTHTAEATLSGKDSGNYTITNGKQNFTIDKAQLTIKANDITVSAGTEPNYTVTYTGFVNGETETVLDGTLAFECAYTEQNQEGTYTITPGGLTSNNYNITYETGTLTVTSEKPVTRPVFAENLTYDGTAHDLITNFATILQEIDGLTGLTITVNDQSVTDPASSPTATNAGEYVIAITLPAGYVWKDADTNPYDGSGTVIINKAKPTFELVNTVTLENPYQEGEIVTYKIRSKDINGVQQKLGTVALKDTNTKNTVVDAQIGYYDVSIYILYNNGEPSDSNTQIEFDLSTTIIFTSTNVNYADGEYTITIAEKALVEPVAYIKETSKYYGTIHKAIEAATSGQSVYLILGRYVTINETLTIKSGVKFYMPYDDAENWDITEDQITGGGRIDTNATNINTYRKSQLIFANEADLIIESGASVYLGAMVGVLGIFSNYTEIALNKGSSIDVYGSFWAYGYVKELTRVHSNPANGVYKNEDADPGRYIRIYSGGYLKSPLSITGLPSGNTLLNVVRANVCPITRFDFTCLQTYVIFDAGAKMDSVARAGVSGTYRQADATVITNDKSVESLFYLTNGTLGVEYLSTKDTQQDVKTNIYLTGTIDLGGLNIDPGVPIDTTKMFLPFSYKFQLYALDGAVFNVDNKLKLLPGCYLQINENATLNVNSELVIHTYADFSKVTNNLYSGSTQDARLIVNGSLVLGTNGKIGGLIETTQSTQDAAICNLTNATSDKLTVTTTEGSNLINVTYVANGQFYNATTNSIIDAQFTAGSIVKSHGSDDCWYGQFDKTYTLQINVKDPDDKQTDEYRLMAYRVYVADDTNGTNQIELTAVGENSSQTYTLKANQYFKVVDSNYESAKFSQSPSGDTGFTSNTWYLANGDYTLDFVSQLGYFVKVSGTSMSGAGSTKYELFVNGNSYGEKTTSGTWYAPKGSTFYIKFTGGMGTSGVLDVEKAEVRQGPEGLTTFSFGSRNTYTLSTNYEIFVTYKACLVEGTLITLADGTKKKVELITENDILLVFNHETGKYDFAKVLFNDTEPQSQYTVINLRFANGKLVKVVSEHGFFDLTLNKYVYIDETNYADFVGHTFYQATWNGTDYISSTTTLANAYLTTENVKVYSPVTTYHMNYFTEDLLSMPGGIEGLFNIFEYDTNLQYNKELMQQDIDTYGLFTYDDFKDLVPIEIYNAFPAQYFKVAMGKNLLTWEQLNYYIERYAPLMIEDAGTDTDNAQDNSQSPLYQDDQVLLPTTSGRSDKDEQEESN